MVMGVTIAHDEYITLRRSEKVGNDAAYGDGLDRSKKLLTIELLNDIVGIPVTGDDDLSAVQLHSRCQRPFLTQATKARERVACRVVHLYAERLTHAHLLLAASSQQNLPGTQY